MNPAVYVDEIGPGPRPITGVPTTIAAFVGFAQDGPLTPTQINSFAEYTESFGEGAPNQFLLHAVRGFFANGGVRCYILRLPPELCGADLDREVLWQQVAIALAPLEELSDVSLVCCPDEYSVPGIAAALVAHCERLRYRIAVLAAPPNASDCVGPPQDVQSSYVAYYMPWLLMENPRGGAALAVHPGGHVAGAIVQNDLRRGVWKAPANLPIVGVTGLTHEINRQQQESLNQLGVNALRNFAGDGIRIWGSRTTSQDPEWKYINLRRYFIYLEKSIQDGTQWAVFENNGETLWGNVKRAVDDFLFNEFKSGALFGITPQEAFFAKCDRSTMTQNDIDNGRLICLVGVAPVRPTEFIIFRICQLTADAQACSS